MKRYGFLVVLLTIMMVGCTKIEQGHVGLKVQLLGSDKGGYPDSRPRNLWQCYQCGVCAVPYLYKAVSIHPEPS